MNSAIMEKIRIVIVNYRTANLVIDCLSSLSTQIHELANVRVDVIDNNSGDGSAGKLQTKIEKENWTSWATIIPLSQNGGFAFGNNASISMAQSSTDIDDYIILLNPDTVALPGAIRKLAEFMNSHPDAGIAGSKLEDADGNVDNSAHSFPNPLSELEGSARLGILSKLLRNHIVTPPHKGITHQCDWVSGASMIIRWKVIEDIGLLDENYFLYFEEVDFCLRAHREGWQCWFVHDSRVIHLEGSSTGIRTLAKRRAGYWYDSRRYFFAKHYGISGLIKADLLWFAGRFSYLIRHYLHLGHRRNLNEDPKWFMFDLLWGDLKAILTGRLSEKNLTGKRS